MGQDCPAPVWEYHRNCKAYRGGIPAAQRVPAFLQRELQKCNLFIRNKITFRCVNLGNMRTEEMNRLHRLEAGQLWKLEHGYIYIVELGKRLIHYKILQQPDQKAVVTRLIGIEALLNYLSCSEAQLLS